MNIIKNVTILAVAVAAVVSTAFSADRADWLRGAWGINWKPAFRANGLAETLKIDYFLDQVKDLESLDYIQLHLGESHISSPVHWGTHDLIESFWEGDMSGGSPINLAVPRASIGFDPFEDMLIAVKAEGLRTQIYVNSANLLSEEIFGESSDVPAVTDRWKNWCDTNPEAQAFIASQSYHTDPAYPLRKYFFCYAEFVLKDYAIRYGNLVDAWLFDAAYNIANYGGDNNVSSNAGQQRIYGAFAAACQAGNPNAAVSFNNGVGERDGTANPFSPATRYDDYTFGHPFAGGKRIGDHTVEVTGLSRYDMNYSIIQWMKDKAGNAHNNDGSWTWDDEVVAHFDPPMSTSAWNSGGVAALTDAEFNLWNREIFQSGSSVTWGVPLVDRNGTNNQTDVIVQDWAMDQLILMDAHLLANGDPGRSANPPPSGDALSGDVEQSSTAHSGVAARAIDGNTNGAWSGGSVTHTTSSTEPWWEIDLGGDYDISEIVIWNRTDNCCKARLSNFDVTILDDNMDPVWTNYQSGYPDPSVSLNPNGATGQYVLVQLRGSGATLSLAEVQVFGTPSTGSNTVSIRKRNATGYALDGGNGGVNGQNVYLWSFNGNNANQQWIEIDRGGGYYSYQKAGTNLCLDGGNGGANNQNVYLWTMNANNQNQHWKKVHVEGSYYRLEKRNAPNFCINGGGANAQNVSLWTIGSSQNLQWLIE